MAHHVAPEAAADLDDTWCYVADVLILHVTHGHRDLEALFGR